VPIGVHRFESLLAGDYLAVRDTKHDYLAAARFRAALREFGGAAEDAARAAGLTPQRYLLLLMTKGAPDGSERATINDLAKRLKVEPHAVTGAAIRAAQVGLVTREPCTEDRRRMWIRVTEEGERKLEQIAAALEQQRDVLVGALEEARRAARGLSRRGEGPGLPRPEQ
jgi:DNA-binding MarR family transcriptional regulator